MPSPPLNAGDVLDALDRCRRGEPYTGPTFEWTCSSLGATRPEPHIALDPEYVERNGIDVDEAYISGLIFAVGVENGWRMAVDVALVHQRCDLPWPEGTR